jgi:hypothetical protein
MEALSRRLESDNSDVGRLLRALFLPKLYGDNLRFASEGAGVKSATGNLSQTVDVGTDWAAAVSTQAIPASDMMCFQFANPLRAFVYYIHNAAGLPYSYTATGPGFLPWTAPQGSTTQSYFTAATADVLVPPFAPHGPYVPPGYDEQGNSYLWVDQSPLGGSTANMSVTFTPAPATNGMNISWYYFNGKSATLLASLKVTAANAGPYLCPTAIPTGGAYMFVRVTNLTVVAATTFTVKVIGNRGIWAHLPIPEISTYVAIEDENDGDSVFKVSGIRVNAAAFKAQNNSQEIEKNGNAISVTVSSKIPWSNIAAGTSYLSGLQNYRERSNDNGYYGVILPDSDEDVSEFFDDIVPQVPSGNEELVSYPLIERRPYKALGLTAPISTGRNFLFDVTHTIEYLTNWKVQSINNPSTSEDSLIAAIVIASTMETDYDNPTHWQDIVNSIGKYGERLVGLQTEGPLSGALDAIAKFHPALTVARALGKNVVLPAQREVFQQMQEYGAPPKKSRGRNGRWVGKGGGQFDYVD